MYLHGAQGLPSSEGAGCPQKLLTPQRTLPRIKAMGSEPCEDFFLGVNQMKVTETPCWAKLTFAAGIREVTTVGLPFRGRVFCASYVCRIYF